MPTTRHGVLRRACAIALALGLGCRTTPPAQPPSAVGDSSAGSEPAFAVHFGPDFTSLFYLADPVPHLRRLLQSRGLTAAAGPDEAPRLRNAAADLEAYQSWIPSEMALGASAATASYGDHALRALFMSFMALSATRAGEVANDDRIEAVASIARHLAELGALDVRVWARFRHPSMAGELLERTGAWLAESELRGVHRNGDSISLELSVQSYATAEQVRALLSAGLQLRPEDPGAAALVQAVTGLSLQLVLERHADQLLLRIGSPRRAAPPATAGPLFQVDSTRSLVLWGKSDLAIWNRYCGAMERDFNEWLARPAGRALLDEGGGEPIQSLLRGLRRCGRNGAQHEFRITANDAVRIEATTRPRSAENPPELELVERLPSDAAMLARSRTTSLADWLELLTNQLGRLTSLDVGQAAATAAIRAVIGESSGTVFAPPVGAVLTFGGVVEVAEPDGHVLLPALPIPELAVVARVTDNDRAMAIVQEFARVVGLALGGADTPPQFTPADLGLGPPTVVLDNDPLSQLLARTMSLRGDWRPHLVFHDGFMVLSTSPRLSRDILTANHARPNDSDPREVLFDANVDPRACAAYLRDLGAALAKVEPDASELLEPAARALSALARIRWVEVAEADHQRTDITLGFAE